jgi:hypothetical protein
MHACESFKVSYNSLNNRINPNTKDNSNNGKSEKQSQAKFSFSSDTVTSHTTLSA